MTRYKYQDKISEHNWVMWLNNNACKKTIYPTTSYRLGPVRDRVWRQGSCSGQHQVVSKVYLLLFVLVQLGICFVVASIQKTTYHTTFCRLGPVRDRVWRQGWCLGQCQLLARYIYCCLCCLCCGCQACCDSHVIFSGLHMYKFKYIHHISTMINLTYLITFMLSLKNVLITLTLSFMC